MLTRRSLGRITLWLALVTALIYVAVPRPSVAAKAGGKLVFAARQDIDTLDPHITNRAATRKILIQFMDTLVVIDPKDGSVKPGLAEKWEIAPDGKTYTFHLRLNVKFHDGTPFDAAAMKFIFDRIQTPLGAPGVARSFTGPYMVKEWITKDQVALVRNPAYNWAPALAEHQGPAYLDEIAWRFVLEAPTRTAVIQTGEVKVAEDLSYADVAGLEKNGDIRILRGVPAGTPWTIYPNVQRPPTNDLAVRRALGYAINKDAIVRVVFHGESRPAWSLLQPTTPGYAPLAKELSPYDPGKAKKTLDETGWKPGSDGIRVKDGKRLEILRIFGANNGYEEMAPLIQAMAREVGMDIQLREQPRAQMEEANRKSEHNIGEVNWWFPDPAIMTTNFHTKSLFGFNRPRLSNLEIDQMLDQAAAMTAEGPRMELYKKIQRTLFEMAAAYPLVDQVTIVGVRKEVKGYRFNVVTFPILYDVSLEK